MRRFLLISASILLVNYCYGQKISTADYSKIITTKKVMLTRQGSEPDSLMIPVVSANYPELRRALSDTNLFLGDKLDAVVKRYQADGSGITSFNYAVTFVNKDVISLELYYETMGAYPDNSQEWLTLNIHTGSAYPLSKEISPAGLDWIYTNYKALLKKRLSTDEDALDKDKVDDSYIEIYKDLTTSTDELTPDVLLKNYIFTAKGIIFTTDAILPHDVKNFEPDRKWLVPYAQLKPYILPGAVVLK